MIAKRPGDIVAEAITLGGRCVVDVGCGDGTLCRVLAGKGARTLGIEPNENLLIRARATEPTDPPPADPPLYVRAVGERLPLADSSVDGVIFFNSLHHVPTDRQDRALAEAGRVVVPHGTVLVIEPLAEGPFFEAVRIIDDETAVRAHAQRVLHGAGALGLTTEAEHVTAMAMVFSDFAALCQKIVAVDETRRAAVEAAKPQLEARFLKLADRRADGYHFLQPLRVHRLAKPPLSPT